MSDSDVEKSPVSTKRAREASFEDQATEKVTLDPKDQKKLISQLQEQHFKDGESWCLISKTWYDAWTKYCARMSNPDTRSIGEKTHPGPIRNQSLFKNGQIAEDLYYGLNVYGVPMSAWEELVTWYGVHEESPDPIERQVISIDNGLTVEIHPPQFRLYAIEHDEISSISNLERCPVITLSRTNLVKDFLHAVREAFDLAPDTEIQAWILKESPVVSKIPNISVTNLSQATLLDTDDQDATLSLSGKFNLAIETKLERFPSESLTKNDTSSVSSTSSVFANGFNNLSTSTPPPPPSSLAVTPKFARGVCGLQNLGNTCFMNSALQCLSNTSQLTKYFLADLYKKDLNRENTLGLQGQMAEKYGELIKELWSGQESSVAPRSFKFTLGKFNSQFNGYQQHDSQEVLAVLLDGLHEDLNKILKKPYTASPDYDGLTDKEIANLSWEHHCARNQSYIVDLFQGQFKSRLTCGFCNHVSVTFDPFTYLSLPLPVKKQIKTSIVYVPYDPSQQMQRMVVTLNKEASIAHLQKEVAKMMSVEDPTSLLVVEIFSHKIYKVMPLYEPVAAIGSSDIIYVYQLPGPVPPVPKRSFGYSQQTEPPVVDENQLIVFPVYCATVSTNESSYNCDRVTQFGEPIVLAVPYKDADKPDLLYKLVSQHIERYTQFKLFEEIKENNVTESFNTKELSSDTVVVENGQPMDEELPPYETIMNHDASQDMDVDVQPQLIHTAAAVLPAGGKKIEPMSNLFAMKVFSATRSYSRDEELLPTTQNWTNLIDLRERAEREYLQRQEYYKEQKEDSADDSDMDEPTANSTDLNLDLQESITLPSAMEDDDEEDDEDDIVEDAAASYAQDGTNIDSMDDILQDAPFNTQSFEELKDEDETDDLDSIQNNSNHVSDTDSDSQFPATTVTDPTPVINNQPRFNKVPRQKATLPPSTIIRQGEGILLEWTVKKAQQLFGTARSFADENAVNTEAWEDMNDLGDPNLDVGEANQPKQVTLSDCLNEFTKEEELSDEDLWYCPKCKKHQRASKKFDLWRLPEIIVVHLKRFSHSRTYKDKIDVMIDFPITELDLTDRVLGMDESQNTNEDENRLIYDLYAVDNHFGGLGGGHYTAYAQNFEDGNWYDFDDSRVRKVNAADVKTPAAYLLFYKRRRQVTSDTKDVETIIQEAEDKERQQAAKEANTFAPTESSSLFTPTEPSSSLFAPTETSSSLFTPTEPSSLFTPTEPTSIFDDPHQPIGEDQPITEFSQDLSDTL